MTEASIDPVIIRANHITVRSIGERYELKRWSSGPGWEYQKAVSVDLGDVITLEPLIVGEGKEGEAQKLLWLEETGTFHPLGELEIMIRKAIGEYTQIESFRQHLRNSTLFAPRSYSPAYWSGKAIEIPVSFVRISRFAIKSTNSPVHADLELGRYLKMTDVIIYDREKDPKNPAKFYSALVKSAELRAFVDRYLKEWDLHRLLARIINPKTRQEALRGSFTFPTDWIKGPDPILRFV